MAQCFGFLAVCFLACQFCFLGYSGKDGFCLSCIALSQQIERLLDIVFLDVSLRQCLNRVLQ